MNEPRTSINHKRQSTTNVNQPRTSINRATGAKQTGTPTILTSKRMIAPTTPKVYYSTNASFRQST
ncbi:MAG: hypothetical protein ACTSUE_00025 [Promethearchaeota archaeon]